MAKLEIKIEEAKEGVRTLIKELTTLNTVSKDITGPAADSLAALESKLTATNSVTIELYNQFKYLKASLEKQALVATAMGNSHANLNKVLGLSANAASAYEKILNRLAAVNGMLEASTLKEYEALIKANIEKANADKIIKNHVNALEIEAKAIEKARLDRLAAADASFAFAQKIQREKETALENSRAYNVLTGEYNKALAVARDMAVEFGVDSQQAVAAASSLNILRNKIAEVTAATTSDAKSKEKARLKTLELADAQFALSEKLKKDKANALELARAYNVLVRNVNIAKNNVKDAAMQWGVNSNQVEKAKVALNKLRTELAEVDDTVKASKPIISTFTTTIRSLLSAFGIIGGIQLFATVIKDTFSLMKTMDSLNFAMQRITSSSFEMAESQRFLIEITTDFGAELVSTSIRWTKFLAAAKQSGVTLLATENIFETLTHASGVLGLKTDELTSIYLALEQMLSKGKVTTEELRRQLGEKLPGAMGIMAAALDVTVSELDKMLKRGEVLSADALPKFAKAVEAAYGLEQNKKILTLVASQNRLTNSWQEFVKNIITDSSLLSGIFDGIANSINNITRTFSESFDLELKTIAKKKELESASINAARDKVDKELGIINFFEKQKSKIQEKALQILEAKKIINNKKEIDKLEEQYARLVEVQKDYNVKVENKQKEAAYKDLNRAQKLYDDDLKAFQEAVNKKEKTPVSYIPLGGAINLIKKIGANFNVGKLNQDFNQLKTNLVFSTAQLEMFKKQIEEASDIDPNEEGTEKKLSALKEFSIGEKEAAISSLKEQISKAEKEIDLATTVYDRKLELLLKNAGDEKRIAALEESIAEDKAEAEKIALTKDADDRVAEAKRIGKYNVTVENETTAQKKKINEKYDNDIIIAKNKLRVDLNKIEEKSAKDTTKILNEELTKLKNNVKSKLDINKEAEAMALERAKFNGDKINEIKKEYAKKGLQIEIDAIEEYLLNLTIPDAIRVALKKLLTDLKIELFSMSGEDTDNSVLAKEIKTKSELLSLAETFANSVMSIFDSIQNRKLEAINAELDSEQKKYDELARLASDHYNSMGEFVQGNARQKDLLAQEEIVNKKKLEKEKLIEEQKAARIQKQAAIAGIAVKLAQSLMAIQLAALEKHIIDPTGILSKVFKAVQIPLTIATAATETAAVLMAPIPQYKDGLDYATKDHIAIINDGSEQEFIRRGGDIYTTKEKNAIVELKQGDSVIENKKSLYNYINMANIVNSDNAISNKNIDNLLLGIEKSITNGFNKAKINNKIYAQGINLNDEIWRMNQTK